jgi:hypothetical protein
LPRLHREERAGRERQHVETLNPDKETAHRDRRASREHGDAGECRSCLCRGHEGDEDGSPDRDHQRHGQHGAQGGAKARGPRGKLRRGRRRGGGGTDMEGERATDRMAIVRDDAPGQEMRAVPEIG